MTAASRCASMTESCWRCSMSVCRLARPTESARPVFRSAMAVKRQVASGRPGASAVRGPATVPTCPPLGEGMNRGMASGNRLSCASNSVASAVHVAARECNEIESICWR
jgi:hypothetical protein